MSDDISFISREADDAAWLQHVRGKSRVTQQASSYVAAKFRRSLEGARMSFATNWQDWQEGASVAMPQNVPAPRVPQVAPKRVRALRPFWNNGKVVRAGDTVTLAADVAINIAAVGRAEILA